MSGEFWDYARILISKKFGRVETNDEPRSPPGSSSRPGRAFLESMMGSPPVDRGGQKGRGTMIHGIYQMTPRQFRKAIDAGVFGEKRVELLGGIPFVMSQNPPHMFTSRRLLAALQILATLPQWVVIRRSPSR